MKKIAILLTVTFPLLIAWRLLEHIMPTGKHNWFLFYDHYQSANWYVYYTSVYLNIIIFSYVIYELCKKIHPKLKTLCLSLVLLSVARLIIYWLFRGSIAFDVLVGSAIIYSCSILWRK